MFPVIIKCEIEIYPEGQVIAFWHRHKTDKTLFADAYFSLSVLNRD